MLPLIRRKEKKKKKNSSISPVPLIFRELFEKFSE